MKKKLFSLWALALLVFSLAVPVRAYETEPVLLDEAELLTQSQEAELLEQAEAIWEDHDLLVAIILAEGLEGYSPEDYAAAYSEYLFDEDADSIVFLLSMEERDWYIYTCGEAGKLLDDGEVYDSFDDISHYLSDDDYYNGFSVWLGGLPYYLDTAADDTGYEEDGSLEISGGWICLGIGAIAALITVLVMRSGMNTRRQQPSARHYMTAGSYHLNTQQDFFLYSTVTKTARPKDTGSGSSGGRSHGGGGGKF